MAGKKTTVKKKTTKAKTAKTEEQEAEEKVNEYNKETKKIARTVLQRAAILYNYVEYPVILRWSTFSGHAKDWWGSSKMMTKDGSPYFRIDINKLLLEGTEIGRCMAIETVVHELAHVYSFTVVQAKSQYGPLGHHGVSWAITYSQLLDVLLR